MPRKRYTPEEMVAKLRQIEVMTSLEAGPGSLRDCYRCRLANLSSGARSMASARDGLTSSLG